MYVTVAMFYLISKHEQFDWFLRDDCGLSRCVRQKTKFSEALTSVEKTNGSRD